MKASHSFFISVFCVAVCGLCIAAIELGNVSYESIRVTEGTFWAKLRSSPPNEIGDTLAGFFGSLAFLAAAAAVFLQTIELRAQREEFEKQREATQDMAKAMSAQAKIFEDERVEREFAKQSRNVDELIRSLRWRMENSKISWMNDHGQIGRNVRIPLFPSKHSKDEESDEVYFSRALRFLLQVRKSIEDENRKTEIIELPDRRRAKRIHTDVKIVVFQIGKLSPIDKVRTERFQMTTIMHELYALIQDPDLWSGEVQV